MSSESFEVLSAFIDGETIDPEELARALADSGSSAFLVDCARLRRQTREIEPPRPTWAAETRHHLTRQNPRWLVAAGIAAALLAGMLWLARPTPPTAVETLPEPDRVLHFELGVDWS